MANYVGRVGTRMECPQCGHTGEYRVLKTDPRILTRIGTADLFTRIAGKDVSYRRRAKWCSNCNTSFQTLEMPDIFFNALLKEIERLESENNSLKKVILETGDSLLKVVNK